MVKAIYSLGDYYSSKELQYLCHCAKDGRLSTDEIFRLALRFFDSKRIMDDFRPMISECPCFVPVPSLSSSVYMMANVFSSLFNGAYYPFLIKDTSLPPLYSLKKQGIEVGLNNIKVFQTGWIPKGRPVVLVDNVVATGTTITACSEELERGGSDRVFAMTIAVDNNELSKNKELWEKVR